MRIELYTFSDRTLVKPTVSIYTLIQTVIFFNMSTRMVKKYRTVLLYLKVDLNFVPANYLEVLPPL